MPGYSALERPSPNFGGARLGIQEEGEGQTIHSKKSSTNRLVQRHRTSIPDALELCVSHAWVVSAPTADCSKQMRRRASVVKNAR
jgi:hypothetical protein